MPYNQWMSGGMTPGGPQPGGPQPMVRPQGPMPFQAPQGANPVNPMMQRLPFPQAGLGGGAPQGMPQQGQSGLNPMMQRSQGGGLNMQQVALNALAQQHTANAMRQQALARAAMGGGGQQGFRQMPQQAQGMPQRQVLPQPGIGAYRPMPQQAQGMPQRPMTPQGGAATLLGQPNQALLQSKLRSVLGM